MPASSKSARPSPTSSLTLPPIPRWTRPRARIRRCRFAGNYTGKPGELGDGVPRGWHPTNPASRRIKCSTLNKSGPYVEDDPVRPLGVYGTTMEAGDRAVREALPQHVIQRTAWVHQRAGPQLCEDHAAAGGGPAGLTSSHPPPPPTNAGDIACAVVAIVTSLEIRSGKTRRWGTYHFAGGGSRDLARLRIPRSSRKPPPGAAPRRKSTRSLPPRLLAAKRGARPTPSSTAPRSGGFHVSCRVRGLESQTSYAEFTMTNEMIIRGVLRWTHRLGDRQAGRVSTVILVEAYSGG